MTTESTEEEGNLARSRMVAGLVLQRLFTDNGAVRGGRIAKI